MGAEPAEPWTEADFNDRLFRTMENAHQYILKFGQAQGLWIRNATIAAAPTSDRRKHEGEEDFDATP